MESASPATLRAVPRYNPLLLIGAKRTECPPSESIAHAEVARNLQ